MLDFSSIAEFSRANCVSICAFLVPANLFATIAAIALSGLRFPSSQVIKAASVGGFFAVVMILHVYTWFAVGVVMAPTYILLCLAITCSISNLAAVIFNYKYLHQSVKLELSR